MFARESAIRLVLATATLCLACQGSTAPSDPSDAASDADPGCSPGVCGTPAEIGPGVVCASQHPTAACIGGTCCVLGPSSGVPTLEAGACPGECLSPDDVTCPRWVQVPAGVCTSAGDLCCDSESVDY